MHSTQHSIHSTNTAYTAQNTAYTAQHPIQHLDMTTPPTLSASACSASAMAFAVCAPAFCSKAATSDSMSPSGVNDATRDLVEAATLDISWEGAVKARVGASRLACNKMGGGNKHCNCQHDYRHTILNDCSNAYHNQTLNRGFDTDYKTFGRVVMQDIR